MRSQALAWAILVISFFLTAAATGVWISIALLVINALT
jgi:hypothetical protein